MFKERTPWSKKLKEAIHPTPMKQRISECLFKLKIQQRKLERTSYHMQERDQALYGKCVLAVQGKNTELASIYANECAELRKMAKVILHSELALEQVTLRLEAVNEFGQLAATMMPIAGVVRTLKSQLEGVMPEVSLELSSVNETLEELSMEVGETSENTFDISSSSGESQKILQEANLVAEQKMKERFPELPPIPTSEARM
ncbi:MAG: Snf7 family protein [Candidatus Bathyarchaeia archaeon]|jgi:division protein CdvB (Snf7/Vps24/ESCRT-III family)